jgi:hypothetical protein
VLSPPCQSLPPTCPLHLKAMQTMIWLHLRTAGFRRRRGSRIPKRLMQWFSKSVLGPTWRVPMLRFSESAAAGDKQRRRSIRSGAAAS